MLLLCFSFQYLDALNKVSDKFQSLLVFFFLFFVFLFFVFCFCFFEKRFRLFFFFYSFGQFLCLYLRYLSLSPVIVVCCKNGLTLRLIFGSIFLLWFSNKIMHTVIGHISRSKVTWGEIFRKIWPHLKS